MKRILVPTDFSKNADKALDFAVQIAKQAKAEIILIHACALLNATFKDNKVLYKEYNQTIIDKANKKLLLLKNNIENPNISVNIRLYNGNITDSILMASEEHHIDLVIMGTLGDSDIEGKIFGSKTAQIMGRTNVPLLTVPFLSKWNIPKNILLAVNDYKEQPDITNLLFDLAGLFNAKVHIFMVDKTYPTQDSDYLKLKRSAFVYVEKLKSLHKNTDIKHSYLYRYSFQDTIDEFIKDQGIDIAAMVTHKRTLMDSIFNRSVTKKLFYHTQLPLLIIPAIKKKYKIKESIENENTYSIAEL